jgi:hypothetical protein
VCRQGETVPYIICVEVDGEGQIRQGGPSGLAERAYHREELAANPALRVDTEYYLAHQARARFPSPPCLFRSTPALGTVLQICCVTQTACTHLLQSTLRELGPGMSSTVRAGAKTYTQ